MTRYVSQHAISVSAVKEHNQTLLYAFIDTKEKALLDKMQELPKSGFSQKVHTSTVKFGKFIANWFSGSNSKH